ncbi:MAG: hypothetical protein JWO63_426, partial [Frankiales bacterium]|nr:hypothetical protein [Frankiales bacterium]
MDPRPSARSASAAPLSPAESCPLLEWAGSGLMLLTGRAGGP